MLESCFWLNHKHIGLWCGFLKVQNIVSLQWPHEKTSKPRITGFCEESHLWPVDSLHKGQLTRKMFPFKYQLYQLIFRLFWSVLLTNRSHIMYEVCFLNNNNCSIMTVFVILHAALRMASPNHYTDVIMSAMASHFIGVRIVYSTVRSGSDQRKYQSSASRACLRGIHRWPVNSP